MAIGNCRADVEKIYLTTQYNSLQPFCILRRKPCAFLGLYIFVTCTERKLQAQKIESYKKTDKALKQVLKRKKVFIKKIVFGSRVRDNTNSF